MLLSNQYYGYRSRKHHYDHSKRKLKRTQISASKKNVDSDKNILIIKRNLSSPYRDKNLQRSSSRHLYKIMSPSNLAKKLSAKSNIFKQMISCKNAQKSPESKDKREDIKMYKLSPRKLTPNKKQSQPKFLSENKRVKYKQTNLKRNSYLKEIISEKKKKQQKQLRMSKKYDEYVLNETNKKNKQNTIIFEDQSKNSVPNEQKLQTHNFISESFEMQPSIFIHEQKNQQFSNSKYQEDNYQIKSSSHEDHNHNFILPTSKNNQQYTTENITGNNQSKPKGQQLKSQTKHCKKLLNQNNQIISRKIQSHYLKIHQIYQYGQKLQNDNPERLQAFERQIYLCFRMYYEELNNMADTLSGKYGSSNCFKLLNCTIKTQQITEYRLKNSYEINSRIKKLQQEINDFHIVLTRISQSLHCKLSSDPYVKLDKNNFEPELISQLYEQMVQLTQKLKQFHKQSETFSKMQYQIIGQKRKTVMKMILLIGELKGIHPQQIQRTKDICQEVDKDGQAQQYYFQNQAKIVQIVEKFQQMPL